MLSQSGQEVMFKPATSGLLFPIRPGTQLLSPSDPPPIAGPSVGRDFDLFRRQGIRLGPVFSGEIATIRNARRSLTPKRSLKRATQLRFWGALRVFL
ncbi:hypothetical protein XFF6990_200269 [Xanthomonas citri pv. fuscans]|nr:hypothetical protein XFF6990_200269 [Xanthomonas citri pv. fuscans]